jgi:hypothetical protein
MELILHVGLEKTGSTSIQSALKSSRASLLDNGILFPQSSPENCRFLAYNFQAEIEYDDFHYDRRLTSSIEVIRYCSRRMSALQAELKASNARWVVLSSEHLSSRLDERGVQNLAGWCAGTFDSVNIILYTREPAALARSRYSTQLLHGEVAPIDEFVTQDISTQKWYDYAWLLNTWREAFGARCVRTYRVEEIEGGDTSRHFFEALSDISGINGIPAIHGRSRRRRRNKKLGETAITAHRILNRNFSRYTKTGRRSLVYGSLSKAIRIADRLLPPLAKSR